MYWINDIAYLNNKVLNEFLIGSLVLLLLFDHLVLGFLVEFFNEGVDGLHLLDSLGVLLSTLLNSKFNLILLQFVPVVLGKSFLFFGDVFFFLNGEFVLSLFIDGGNSFVSMLSDKGNHGLEHLRSFLLVHLSFP